MVVIGHCLSIVKQLTTLFEVPKSLLHKNEIGSLNFWISLPTFPPHRLNCPNLTFVRLYPLPQQSGQYSILHIETDAAPLPIE